MTGFIYLSDVEIEQQFTHLKKEEDKSMLLIEKSVIEHCILSPSLSQNIRRRNVLQSN